MVSNKQKTSFLTFSKRLNKEKMILIELRKNARKSFAEIARQQEIPVTTVFEIHQKLQEKIIKHTTLVDFEKIGFPIRALIAVNNNKKTLEWLKNREEVNNLHLSKNHLLAEIIFPNIKEKHEFMEEINGLTKTKTYDIINEVKRETFQP